MNLGSVILYIFESSSVTKVTKVILLSHVSGLSAFLYLIKAETSDNNMTFVIDNLEKLSNISKFLKLPRSSPGIIWSQCKLGKACIYSGM